MASTSPSPNSSPSAVPPTSTASSPPPQVSSPPPSNPTIASPPPSTTLPSQTSEPPGPSTPSNSSATPPRSPPLAPPRSPPPSSSQSPPPPSAPPTSPPPPSTPSTSPPPPSTPPTSPPLPSTPSTTSPPLPSTPSTTSPPSPSTPSTTSPPLPSTPPTSPPPSPPVSPSPSISSPPPSPPASTPPPPSPPTAATSPPSSNSSAPPPLGSSSPPPQAATPPEVVSRSPPPANVPTPPSSSPPPPETEPPKNSPPEPALPPPPTDSNSASPPANDSSPASMLPSPPPSVPSSSAPPLPSPPASTNSLGPSSNLPSIPTQKPTAKPTTDGNVAANATSKGGGLNTGGAVTIGIAVGLVVLCLIVMAVWFVKKQKKRRNRVNVGYGMPSPSASSQNSESLFLRPYSPAPRVRNGSVSDFVYSPPEQGGVSNSRSWFTYEELLQATKGFSTENLLGEGGFGCVYKGALADGREVAVKQLKIGGGQGEREFRAEVEIISRVHHRHLVSLVGYCISDNQRLLVYEYVPNNTLYYHLHGEGRPVMDWSTRVRVAAGAARGIAYLHEDCHPRIIHRDIKSSNILLDSNFEARVADFGLAKLALDSNTHVTTRVMGTFGYMAPEYATSGKLTEKSDVYSYGVVLLELITGRKPVDASQPMGDESLVEWARPLLSHAIDNEDFEGLVDPRLEKNYVAIEMFRMVEAAAACVRHSATKRPKMSLVVRALDSMYDTSDLSNGMKPGQSEIFDSAEQSAQIRMFRRMAFGSQDYSTDSFNQTRSSWASRESRDQSQSSWASRDHGNQSRVVDINRSGLGNNN